MPCALQAELGIRSARLKLAGEYTPQQEDYSDDGGEASADSDGERWDGKRRGRRRDGGGGGGSKRSHMAKLDPGAPVLGALLRMDEWPPDCDAHGIPLAVQACSCSPKSLHLRIMTGFLECKGVASFQVSCCGYRDIAQRATFVSVLA